MEESKYSFYTKNGLYGRAIEYSRIDSEGRMWVGNGEYESQVNYCPMTGKQAPIQLTVVEVFESGTENYK